LALLNRRRIKSSIQERPKHVQHVMAMGRRAAAGGYLAAVWLFFNCACFTAINGSVLVQSTMKPRDRIPFQGHHSNMKYWPRKTVSFRLVRVNVTINLNLGACLLGIAAVLRVVLH
jgi:hypothetical protein